MIEVPFQIVRTPYPPQSKMVGEVTQKIRPDGRVGPVVGDEALLWDALQESKADVRCLKEANAHLLQQYLESGQALESANAALAQLRQQYDALRAEADDLMPSQVGPQDEPKKKGRRQL